MKYWDINQILRYNRNFNFINGERSIGKTYTSEKFIVKEAILKSKEFVYIVRTQDEKKRGIFKSAFAKVLQNEYPSYNFKVTNDEIILEDNENGERILGYCFALSEAVKIKKRSFPKVFYMLFDEYMLEDNHHASYITGWNEPDLFLSIYHTIDRENDRVRCFLLGNNTSFYNPYHLHKAFNIPYTQKGDIWHSENVLFQWAVAGAELKEEKNKSKFLRMIEQTKYGTYAAKGEYINDNTKFIEIRDNKSKHYFTFSFSGEQYGVWLSSNNGVIYISLKFDPSCKLYYALTLDDHRENTLLTKSKENSVLQWLAKNFKMGNVRFESMEIKKKTEQAIIMLL